MRTARRALSVHQKVCGVRKVEPKAPRPKKPKKTPEQRAAEKRQRAFERTWKEATRRETAKLLAQWLTKG